MGSVALANSSARACWCSAKVAGAGSVHEAASALTLTPEHVRLYCEIASTGPPPTTANGLPVSPARAEVLSPARLRDLYEHQNLPMIEIAALAGCATATIRRLLQIDGVPQRAAYHRPPPESGITREWLHREYVVKLRSIDTLARERGVCAPYLKNLARNWGLPIRRHSDFSGIGHLDLPAPPSPAMRAVTMRTGALGRLELITRIPGHASIAAAARALYGGRGGALRQMIAKIEAARVQGVVATLLVDGPSSGHHTAPGSGGVARWAGGRPSGLARGCLPPRGRGGSGVKAGRRPSPQAMRSKP